jgi:hypothetical protein
MKAQANKQQKPELHWISVSFCWDSEAGLGLVL